MLHSISARHVNEVVIRTSMTSICPLTKTTDFYELTLSYTPRDGKYLELSSLKEFLESFRDKEVFHEDLASVIAESVCKEILAENVNVELKSTFLGMEVTIVKILKC
ncbi:MAG: hypothetical protein QXW58_05360 [Thermosphaera sp.]